MIDSTSLTEHSLELVVRDSSGNIKHTRYIKPFGAVRFEFSPNRLYLKLINSGRIQPNTWKIPFLLGLWKVFKDI